MLDPCYEICLGCKMGTQAFDSLGEVKNPFLWTVLHNKLCALCRLIVVGYQLEM